MQVEMCMAKIHRATVTEAELDYVGSITIDEALLEASGIIPGQFVYINNLANGHPWSTYVLPGKRDSGVICLNGPPAHHFKPGNIVVILAKVLVDPLEQKIYRELGWPRVVFVDNKNRVTTKDAQERALHPRS